MNYSRLFSLKNILKIFLISLSLIFWVYFYINSNISLDILIIFDLPSIMNTFFTTNFLIFLILFPITTSLIISFSYKGENKTNILITGIGIILGSLISLLLFGFDFNFVIFLVLYLIIHIVINTFTKTKFESEAKSSVLDTANYSCSKISLFLTIILFIILFISLLPNQQQKAVNLEVGIVNLFVGDDLSNWLGTSYSISKSCTKQNLEQIMGQPQYKALEEKTDVESINFTNYLDSTYDSIDDESSFDLANLNTLEVKENVLNTIRTIPMMVIVEKYFAIVFSFVVVSFAYLYFGLAFGILGVIFVIIFRKLLDSKHNNSKDNDNKVLKNMLDKDINTNLLKTDNTKEESTIEEKISEDKISQEKQSDTKDDDLPKEKDVDDFKFN